MTDKIYRYELDLRTADDDGWITIHACYGIVMEVGAQGDNRSPQVWMRVVPTQRELRRFKVVPTGGDYPDDLQYLGTVVACRGTLVWHVFQDGDAEADVEDRG